MFTLVLSPLLLLLLILLLRSDDDRFGRRLRQEDDDFATPTTDDEEAENASACILQIYIYIYNVCVCSLIKNAEDCFSFSFWKRIPFPRFCLDGCTAKQLFIRMDKILYKKNANT